MDIASIFNYILFQLGMWFYCWNTFDSLILLHWVSVSSWNQLLNDLSKIRLIENMEISSIFSLTHFRMASINSHSNWCILVAISSKIVRISTCTFHVNNAVFSQILLQNNPVFFPNLKQSGSNAWKERSYQKIKVFEQKCMYRYIRTSNLERGLGSGCQK